ncbi:hypothetical protein FHS95_000120 [Sphingomonas naasensis]|uniref:Uncharacterized protein n=1 Tax=Sphingomonas naasensis TaxID=1344951 RepID=A0A4S1WSR1_9SPHN|nr:hypothetical protein [Sphingomonas naasensis]NIJ18451.1 hypothetical protein [Sphingomonas naasensis]TGX45715.1 hypothetical protein E5A74_00595 [Sphingomonas naasensis]
MTAPQTPSGALDGQVTKPACDIVAELRTFAMNMRRDDSDARSDDLRFYYEGIEGFADLLDAALAERPAMQMPEREDAAEIWRQAYIAVYGCEPTHPKEAYQAAYDVIAAALHPPASVAEVEGWQTAVREAMERALLMVAPSKQGGHSEEGMAIAEALGVPFPLSMDTLRPEAIKRGFMPYDLWPWLKVSDEATPMPSGEKG